jgi:FdhE protein
MQRVLDPAQIEAFGQRAIPRIRLPDRANIFSRRAARLRKLSEGHAVGDYLRLMATLADAQQRELDALTAEAVALDVRGGQDAALNGRDRRHDVCATREGPHAVFSARDSERLRTAREHGMPPLQADGWPLDPHWRTVLFGLCDAIASTPGFPAGVATTCSRIRDLPVETLAEQAGLLLGGSSTGVDAQAAPFIMAALQVYWTRMVCSFSHDEVAEHIGGVDVPGVCPVCGTLPVASVVRAEQGYQGYRYLHCALCATEWHLVRIKCSHCESTAGIHYHTIEGGSTAIRAESCDECRTYRKICYQEHDMEVEPLADDLGSLSLDLLMTEAGFHRGSGNPLLWQPADPPASRRGPT